MNEVSTRQLFSTYPILMASPTRVRLKVSKSQVRIRTAIGYLGSAVMGGEPACSMLTLRREAALFSRKLPAGIHEFAGEIDI
jgi:hypothetical protein